MALLAALLFIVACETAPEPSPTAALPPTATSLGAEASPSATVPPSAPVPSSPTPSPSPTPAPVALRLVYPRGWETLNPYATVSPDFFLLFSNAYSGLLRYRTGPEVGPLVHEVAPDLAVDWQHPNPTTYLFHLRPDAWWPEVPGLMKRRRVTADDVVTSVQRLALDSAHRWLWKEAKLQAVGAQDEDTVIMVTAEPFAPFLSYVASGFNVILPQEVWQRTSGDLARGPVAGSGPFLFLAESSDRGQRAIFRRNPDFYEPGSNLDYLEWWIVEAPATRLALVEAGQADVVWLPLAPISELREGSTAGWSVDVERRPATWSLSLQNRYPLSDRRVRQALSLAIDRRQLLNDLFGGADLLGLGMPVPSAALLLPAEEVRAALRYDPALARELLRAALLPGEALGLELTVGDFGEASLQAGERIRHDLGEVGVQVELRVAPAARYIASVLAAPGAFQAAFGPSHRYFEADQWLTSRFHPLGAANGSGIDDADLTALIEGQKGEMEPLRRGELLFRAQRRILQEHYEPPLYLDGERVVRRAWVRGWSSFPDYPFGRFLRGVRIEGRERR